MLAAALVNTVYSWRTARVLAVLLAQRRLEGRGEDFGEVPHEHVLQVLQLAEEDLPLILSLLTCARSRVALCLDRSDGALAAASRGAALAITVSIAARTAAICRSWQQALPRVEAKRPASQPISQNSRLTRKKQQQQLQSSQQPERQQQQQLLLAADVAARLLQSKAALGKGAASIIDDLALSTQLPSELGLLAGPHAGAGNPQKDTAPSQQSEQEEQECLDDLFSGLTEAIIISAMPEGAAAGLAAACVHTKLPPALQGAWRGSAAVSVCAGSNCDGNGHGVPLILKVYADLCSVAAAAPIEDRAQRRERCEQFRKVLLVALEVMPAHWKSALPPPPLWPPTAAEAAAATEQARAAAEAQAASDTMMRLLLEVHSLPFPAGRCRPGCISTVSV